MESFTFVGERLYLVTYYDDNMDLIKEVFPEFALNTIEHIEKIKVLGRLSDSFGIIELGDPEDPQKEPVVDITKFKKTAND